MLFFLSTAALAQSPRDESPAAAATGSISGRVTNETGQPVAGATVSLRGSSPFFQARMTSTDSEGNFQVTDLGAELYAVSAFAPGYIAPPRDPESPPVYHRIGDSVDLSIVRGGVITGSVMSSSGEPLVHIAVRAMMIRDANGEGPRFPATHTPRSTDDRGVYRIYGLVPGTYLVSAGGRHSFGVSSGAFDADAATFSPSSTRDTAAEIVVKPGEETTGVDIRYRAEPGRVISGGVAGPPDPTGTSQPTVNLVQMANGVPLGTAISYQTPGSKGFSFYGVSDGDYDLVAQLSLGPGQLLVSEPRRVTVKGADIAGLELTVKPLGAIEGHLSLEASPAPECQNKRKPMFSETLVSVRRISKPAEKDQAFPMAFSVAQGSPNPAGNFMLRNLSPGNYRFSTRFSAKYWFLRSIIRETGAQRANPKTANVSRGFDVARHGLSLKSGERITGVNITLAEGAASLRGTIKLAPGESVPSKLNVHLVPTEEENSDDALRQFSAPVSADGMFAFNNLPPGNYFAVARIPGVNEFTSDTKLRVPEAELRALIRRAAESERINVEFKPCQNMVDFRLPIALPAP